MRECGVTDWRGAIHNPKVGLIPPNGWCRREAGHAGWHSQDPNSKGGFAVVGVPCGYLFVHRGLMTPVFMDTPDPRSNAGAFCDAISRFDSYELNKVRP